MIKEVGKLKLRTYCRQGVILMQVIGRDTNYTTVLVLPRWSRAYMKNHALVEPLDPRFMNRCDDLRRSAT